MVRIFIKASSGFTSLELLDLHLRVVGRRIEQDDEAGTIPAHERPNLVARPERIGASRGQISLS
jgi:hypothetical protein